jgi:hypothetical protein
VLQNAVAGAGRLLGRYADGDAPTVCMHHAYIMMMSRAGALLVVVLDPSLQACRQPVLYMCKAVVQL